MAKTQRCLPNSVSFSSRERGQGFTWQKSKLPFLDLSCRNISPSQSYELSRLLAECTGGWSLEDGSQTMGGGWVPLSLLKGEHCKRNFCCSKPLSPEDLSVTAASVLLIKDVWSDHEKTKKKLIFYLHRVMEIFTFFKIEALLTYNSVSFRYSTLWFCYFRSL